MTDRRLDVTGRGIVSALGQSVADFAAAIFAGRSAIVDISEQRPSLRFSMGAPIRDFDPSAHFDDRDRSMLDRFTQFAAVAARSAWREAGLDREAPDPRRVAVVVGTANGGIDTLDDGYRRLFVDKSRLPPLTIPRTMASAPASRIAREIGARGPVFGVTSACASAAHAILAGAGLVRDGLVDVAVVGGADSCFSEGFLRAWDALRVVSSDTCRPFSAGRRGLILGEGAAILVLERPGRAAVRGMRPAARFLGGGMSCDAGDLVAPDPTGMADAVRAALADAGHDAAAIDYVNAHGTGTVANDRAEAAAMVEVFGERARSLPISSTKSMIGHAMGAAGAIEAIATVAALAHGVLPPTLNRLGPDPEIDLDTVPDTARTQAIDVAMSNSFAFGGLDVSLIFGRGEG
ncbi:MAG: beta-ketoacyl-[acyl-carrier-protein] synthase family protein [Phyllobacteriaceae bacterium]|nr:beta-ketoacyl-[acyl-carrier-protein] synthase family protein [Phyllobacteriaceae bacterium]